MKYAGALVWSCLASAIAIAADPLSITTDSLPNATVFAQYQQTLAATGGSGNYTWSMASGNLPDGLNLAANGTISGKPTAVSNSNFVVQVNDGSTTATKRLSIKVGSSSLSITTDSLPDGMVGTPYRQPLTAAGGVGFYNWSVISGNLPQGLSLAVDGILSGTPTAAGTASFTVQVKDSVAVSTKALSIRIIPPPLTITTASLPNGTVGNGYQQSLSATGGAGNYTWSVTSGNLPQGLTLSANGTISGTPAAAGASSFTVQVGDGNTTATKQLSVTISTPPISITTSSLPNATAGVAYQQSLSATGGSGNYTWSITSGSLPQGLTLVANGTISGTAMSAGTGNFTVQVKDSGTMTATRPFTITVAPAALAISTNSLASGSVGQNYSQSLAATGGAGNYSWQLVGGSLPSGLQLDPRGVIGGVPAAAGTFQLNIQVTDAASGTASRNFTLTVAGTITIAPGPPPGGTVGANYSYMLSASGGTGPYKWSLSSGALPPGLSLNDANGTISGTATTAGTFAFFVQAIDTSSSTTATRSMTITISPALRITTQPPLANASLNSPYQQALSASGGQPPYRWTIVSGALSDGLSLDAGSGQIGGTPKQAGTFNFTVQVSDATSSQARADVSLLVSAGLTISTPPTLSASVSVPFTLKLLAAGGAPPLTWAVTAGSLPSGLAFHPDGQIDGTPTTSGTFTFTVQVSDGTGASFSKEFKLTVASPLQITTAPALPAGAAGAPYSQTLAASGGTSPYTWSVTAGSLPAGIALDAQSGTLSGTPGESGNFTFTVTVTDTASIKAEKQFTISIGAGLTFTSPASLPNAAAGAAYTFTLQAAGGRPPYTWSVAGGSLPDGLSLNASTGVISGVPSTAGTFNFTLGVADTGGLTGGRVHTIVIGLPALPAISISGINDTVAPLDQPHIDVTLAQGFPVPINGRLTISFAPASNMPDDPAVQFSSGSRSATFVIPANGTRAEFPAPQFAVQTGSVAGKLTLSIESLQAGGAGVSVPDGATRTASLGAAAPVMRNAQVVRTAGGFQVQITGLSTTREVTQADVRFTPRAGSDLRTTQVTVPLGTASTTWFQKPESAAYGGQFNLTLPFSLQGSADALDSISVTLSNSSGKSQETTVRY